jgi:NAD(P)-dependent dehydrogenase (short-subunit alcohol dehydrogenase family)
VEATDSDAPRVTVVTGASGGLGSAIAERFATGGDTVFVGYHRGEDRAGELVDALRARGLRAFPLSIDLASVDSVEAAFEQVAAEAGTVDVLVNNAAYRPIGPFLELPESEWEAVLSVNLMGAVRCSRCVLPGMVERKRGRIINISGLDALWGWGNRAHVTVSKAGLMGLSRAIAVEFAHLGITANTLVPGSFRVPRDPAIYPDWEEMRGYLVDRIPVGRQGEADELAECCWFLASAAGAYITAQDIHVNGGAYPLLRNPLFER